MEERWNAAPDWLRVVAVVLTPWAVVTLLVGLMTLVMPGAGVLTFLFGLVLASPWLLIARGVTTR